MKNKKNIKNAVKINRLNDTLAPKVAEIFTDMSVPQKRNMVWLMIGIFLSRNVHLSKIAEHIAIAAKETSIASRLSRFLAQFGADIQISYAKVIVPILNVCVQVGKYGCSSMAAKLALAIN